MEFTHKDTAQKCKTTGEIMEVIRTGCVCGCSPDKGFLKVDNNNIGELKQARQAGKAQEFYKSVWVDAEPKQLQAIGLY